MRKKNIKSIEISLADLDRQQAWIERCKIFLELSRAGIDFIHSDLDALWDRDIRKYLSRIKNRNFEFDIAFSCGTYNPPSFWELCGFVLCAGLFYSKSNKVAVSFWQEVLRNVEICSDD